MEKGPSGDTLRLSLMNRRVAERSQASSAGRGGRDRLPLPAARHGKYTPLKC